jgi:uncharacterized OB-fold protein
MAIIKLHLIGMDCKRCGHKWIPRKEDVRLCPRCKTAYFDRGPIRITKKTEAEEESQSAE